jgi:hypothetical protein
MEERNNEFSLVSTHRRRLPKADIRRSGVKFLAVALACLSLAYVAMHGARRTTLESEAMKEYNLAQAKALVASDEVEVRNSKRRLALIKEQLGEKQDDDKGDDAELPEDGLSQVLLTKAEEYELHADLSQAKVAKEALTAKNKKALQAAKQQAAIQEKDDKMFANALRRAAGRDIKTEQHSYHKHLFLQQYGSPTALKVGQLKEITFLKEAEDRLKIDRKNVEILLAAQDSKPVMPATATDTKVILWFFCFLSWRF